MTDLRLLPFSSHSRRCWRLPRPGARAVAGALIVIAASLHDASAQVNPPAASASVPAGPRVAVPAATPAPRTADYILAVVNSELVTNNELQQRLARIREDASRGNSTLPPPTELRKQVLDVLIDERVQITN